MATGTATIDFGATPAETATAVVTTSGLTAASFIEAFFMRETTADNGIDEHEEAAVMCPLVCEYVNATTFNIIATPINAYGLGTFKVRWVTA